MKTVASPTPEIQARDCSPQASAPVRGAVQTVPRPPAGEPEAFPPSPGIRPALKAARSGAGSGTRPVAAPDLAAERLELLAAEARADARRYSRAGWAAAAKRCGIEAVALEYAARCLREHVAVQAMVARAVPRSEAGGAAAPPYATACARLERWAEHLDRMAGLASCPVWARFQAAALAYAAVRLAREVPAIVEQLAE